MCAINGITANDTARVTLMNEATKHRGPDGTHVWNGDGITLGHNRLAIIDLSERALQPMRSNDGRYTIVFNGEIYNYLELRTELEHTYQFKTESDTEVLIAAYSTWGEEMFPRLRGMFAFGIWDIREQSLLLARDHMGIKPLYYREEDAVLAFSSELSAFMREKNVLNPTALALYLEFQYVPSPTTLIHGVVKLPPGHLLRFKKGTSTVSRYYSPEEGIGVPVTSSRVKPVSTNELYATIDKAVKQQLVSDRPVGMFLSGGIDSSIVLHHMAKHTKDVRTFSVGFEMVTGAEGEHEKFNADARLAERTALHCGATHTTYTLSLSDVRQNFESILASLDEPVANPTAIAQHFLSERVRNDGVVVALGGDGGDEVFLGYTRHRMLMASYLFQKLPHVLQDTLGYAHPRIKKLGIQLGAEAHVSVMANKEKNITPYILPNLHPYTVARDHFVERYHKMTKKHHPLDTFMYVDRATWLPEESLHRSDRTSMAHGLELRVPLIDLSVVTLGDQIPVSAKLSPFEGKKILRDTYRAHLPAYLFSQPKRGWVSPGAKWLRDPEILKTVEAILSPEYYSGLSELYNWSAIQTLLQDHVEKRTYALYPLWNLLVLQIWARKNAVVWEDLTE